MPRTIDPWTMFLIAAKTDISSDDGTTGLSRARDEMYLTGSSAAVGVCYPASEWPRVMWPAMPSGVVYLDE